MWPGFHLLGYASVAVMSRGPVERPETDELIVIIQAAKAGSSEAIGTLLDRHRDYLMLIANEELTRHGPQTHGPSDIVQWTQLEACRDFNVFKGSTAAEFRAWLRRILLNNLADNRRRVRLPKVSLGNNPPADDKSPSSQAASNEAGAALHAFFATLPHDEQRVVQLRYFEGKSYAEIGQIIGRSSDATRKLWTRVLTRLQSHMKRQT